MPWRRFRKNGGAACSFAKCMGFPIRRSRRSPNARWARCGPAWRAPALSCSSPFTPARPSAATCVGGWFGGKLDSRFRIPGPPATRLLGARLCDVGGRQFPLAAYDREGRRLSLFALGASAGSRGGTCREGVAGFTVCRQVTDGIDYMLVSDYPGAEAKRILTAMLSERP